MVEIIPDISASPSRSYTRQYHFDTDRMAGTVSVWGAKSAEDATDTGAVNNVQPMQPTAARQSPEPTLSFGEFFDVVNPLHHIPIVNTIYQNLTGDDVSPVAKILGGGLYGGPIGAATSIVAAAMEEHGGDNHPHVTRSLSNTSSQGGVSDDLVAHKTHSSNQWNFND